MKLVRFISLEEKVALEEGRTLSDSVKWGERFPGTTSYGKCFLEGDANHIRPNPVIGVMRRDRFLSFLSDKEADYDFALELEGEEKDILKIFTKEKGTYPNEINMDEWCLYSYSLALFEEHRIKARFVGIPHFVSGY